MTDTKNIPGGIVACRCVRYVHLSEAWPALREAFYRNVIAVDYQEPCREGKDAYGRTERKWCPGLPHEHSAAGFRAAALAFIENHTTGLYYAPDTGRDDQFISTLKVMFELTADKENFRKNFVLLHKLSN